MENENIEQLVEEEIRALISTRYNVVTGIVELSWGENRPFTQLIDRMEKTVLRALKAKGLKVSINTIRNILQSDFSNAYDPFVEYFEKLPQWDETTDYIAQLCAVVKVENNQYFYEWTKKWLVGVVANMLDQNATNHQVLVLTGGQGIGKTTWFNKLVPLTLENYTATGYVNPESKDAQVQSSECFLVNMDELSSLNSKNIEALKQLITQKRIRVRRPYGYNAENLIKRASFCGSTNEEQFLHDYTGNRRFLCFKALDIDLEELSNIDIDGLYTQIYHLYLNGFQYWFNTKENKLIEENNTMFVVRSMEEEAIQAKFSPVSAKYATLVTVRMTATDIVQVLSGYGLISKTNSSAQKVGRALNKLGFESQKSNGRLLYLVNSK